MTNSVYLDNNATTALLPDVQEAMNGAMANTFGNPSSAHTLGRFARAALSRARESVAGLLGQVDPANVVFTSGGTEANNVIIQAAASSGKRARIITTAIEHSSVLHTCDELAERQIAEVVTLPVDSSGRVDIEDLRKSITPETALVSVQYANSETGVVQDIEKISGVCAQAGVLFHTDAVQACGKLPFDVGSMAIDFLTCSAHKINGPKGVGALYAKDRRRVHSLMFGGSQEAGIRPGTENVIGIVGFGAAAEIRLRGMGQAIECMRNYRDTFENILLSKISDARITGSSILRVCNTSNVMFPGVEGAALVAQLDAVGVYCSVNSACNNQRPEPSHVLTAMGMSEEDAYSCVRFCFSPQNTNADVLRAVDAVKLAHDALKALGLREAR